jgi:hypothetical protein
VAKKFTPKPLEWPEPEIYYKVGDRVEFRPGYASIEERCGLVGGQRGVVIEDAPLSILAGVLVQWDDGPESVVSGMQARKLGLLEIIGEL